MLFPSLHERVLSDDPSRRLFQLLLLAGLSLPVLRPLKASRFVWNTQRFIILQNKTILIQVSNLTVMLLIICNLSSN